MHLLKWLYPGMRFKRWLCLFAVGALLTGLGLAIVFNYKYIDSIEEFLFYNCNRRYSYNRLRLDNNAISYKNGHSFIDNSACS